MNIKSFQPRIIDLKSPSQRNALQSLIPNLPVNQDEWLRVTIEPFVKPRKDSQNRLMWKCQLGDIAEQAFLNGRQFSKDAWHYYFKQQFLPEEYDRELTKKGYKKWDYTPDGERILVGSTTQLTVKGFSQYLTQIEAFGASLGVMFGVKE